MRRKLISADRLHKKWMKDPEYRKAYEELGADFARISATIEESARADRLPGPRSRRRSRTKLPH